MPIFTLLGFLVGFLVGLTGIGGGALITPSLILLGVEPLIAVGTALVYASITRVFGVFFHYRKGGIRFDLAWKLFAGSLPAILLGSVLLRAIDKSILNSYLTLLLGAVLVVSSLLSLTGGEIHVPIRPRREYLYVLVLLLA